jgi:hypothetical protein
MMGSQRFFCAAQSRTNQERIYATVARVDRWVLLEYPGPWRQDAVEESCLPDSFKATLSRLERQEPRTRPLLIRQTYRPTTPIRCFLIYSCESKPRILRKELFDYSQLERAEFGDLEASAQPFQAPLYAVCTHGTHDRCCAKFGFPVYTALREQAGSSAWQCSHVGGDRFAGNLVCFPEGIYYGRADPGEIRELMEKHARGEISLKHYRGRCCYSKIAQAADYFLRAESGRMRINEFSLIEVIRGEAGNARVQFKAASDGTIHDIRLRRVKAALSGRLTCNATHPSPITQYEFAGYTVAFE